MAKRKPTVWFSPLVSAQRYNVICTTHEISPEFLDENDEAACSYEHTTISLNDTYSDERKEDCLAHELFIHALLEATGLKRTFRTKLGLTEKQWDDFEEECLARQFAPALLAMLKANRLLKLPKLPRRRTSATTKPRAKTPKKILKAVKR